MEQLIVFAGLPGVGKTTLAKRLAQEIGATYLRIDSIEKPFRESREVKGEGYQAVVNVARENLKLYNRVVIDVVNPVHESRRMFVGLSRVADMPLLQFECMLHDQEEHRRRVESRTATDRHAPTWQQVIDRKYDNWDELIDGARTIIDTLNSEEAYSKIMHKLKGKAVVAESIKPDSGGMQNNVLTPKLISISGSVHSDKTTISRHLAAKMPNAFYVDGDLTSAPVGYDRDNKNIDDMLPDIHEHIIRLIKASLYKGINVIVDFPLTDNVRQQIIESLDSIAFQARWFLLKPDIAKVLTGSKDRPELNEWEIARIQYHYTSPLMSTSMAVIIDSTKQTPENTLKEIEKQL